MLITATNLDELQRAHSHLPFDYDQYRRETDVNEGELDQFHVVNTSTAVVRPAEEWNALGREIYDTHSVSLHACALWGILQELGLNQFLMEHHSSVPVAWFPISLCAKPFAQQRKRLLVSSGVQVDLHTWLGGFQLENLSQDFLVNFVDYPFLSQHLDFDLISQQRSFVLNVTHHLSVICLSSDRELLARFESMAKERGIYVSW